MQANPPFVAGIDVGTECVKAIILAADRSVLGRGIVPTRGHFQDCVQEAFGLALEEAQLEKSELARICATGFGARAVADASATCSETACHARGAFHYFPHAMTVVDVGGRVPHVIQVGGEGQRIESRSARRCALGIGSFLMFSARHLGVHPTRLEELAASVDKPASIGSYCSVFAGSEILEQLLEGATPGEIALGCIRSVAERIFEVGELHEPLVVTGGVPEYFPGVVKALGELSGLAPRAVPEPIITGAFGAALRALRALEGAAEKQEASCV
jgi:(R)-2-hydroxyacyl-CoA dehydratese activating ATPase